MKGLPMSNIDNKTKGKSAYTDNIVIATLIKLCPNTIEQAIQTGMNATPAAANATNKVPIHPERIKRRPFRHVILLVGH